MSKLEKIATRIWAVIFIVMILQYYFSYKNTKEFIVEPHVGDLYVVKAAYIDGSGYENRDTRLAGMMKLIEINENMLTFVISKKIYFNRGSLALVKEYSNDAIHLQRSYILSLYDRDIIEEIRRK